MNRVAIAGVWVASIVATYLLVRSTDGDKPVEATPAATRGTVRVVRSASAPRLDRVALEVPEDNHAFRDALATLERDISDGRWSADDRDRLNASSRTLTAPEAGELYEVLFPKLNDGTVKSDIEGPPI